MLLYAILAAICFVSYFLVLSIVPRRSGISAFDLKREGAPSIHALRERTLDDVVTLQRIVVGLLLLIGSFLASVGFGVGWGLLAGVVALLLCGSLARVKLWGKLIQGVYDRYESSILAWVARSKWLGVFRRPQPVYDVAIPVKSRAELGELVRRADSFLSKDERSLLLHGLEFHEKQIKQTMTLRKDIVSVQKDELLGPLVLDDLHKTGHSWFPVVDGGVDSIIGLVGIEGLLTLDVKKSMTAQKAMTTQVEFIDQHQTLRDALSLLVAARHHMLIVTDEKRKVVGLLNLGDILEALFGAKIHSK